MQEIPVIGSFLFTGDMTVSLLQIVDGISYMNKLTDSGRYVHVYRRTLITLTRITRTPR